MKVLPSFKEPFILNTTYTLTIFCINTQRLARNLFLTITNPEKKETYTLIDTSYPTTSTGAKRAASRAKYETSSITHDLLKYSTTSFYTNASSYISTFVVTFTS